MKTNYWLAWIEFKKSDEYRTTYESMKNKGIKQRFANNMLRVAFDAGWGNRKIVTLHPKPNK